MNLKFNIGDICLTQHSIQPVLNDDLLVIVVGINHGITNHRGEHSPYLIKRLDSKVFASTRNAGSGTVRWFQSELAYCQEHKIRKAIFSQVTSNIQCTEPTIAKNH